MREHPSLCFVYSNDKIYPEDHTMLRSLAYIICLFLAVIFIAGCSDNAAPTSPDPVVPDNGISEGSGISDGNELSGVSASTDGSRQLWGAYTVAIDVKNLVAEVEQLSRDAMIHVDVTKWVSPPECNDCMVVDITGFDFATRIASVTVTLKNPFGVTGYDVRAVAQNYDLKEFLGVEGYSDLWNDVGEKNPYYCFAIENPTRAFTQYANHSRDIKVHIPDGATGLVTIVVDASWPDQCEDVYEVKTEISSWLINDGDDNTKILAWVYDHQGNVESVSADLSPLGGSVEPMLDDGDNGDGDPGDGIFGVNGISTTVPLGDYEIWVSCKSAGSDIITYQKALVKVSDVDPYRGDPDYDRIYDDTQVKRIDIFISPDNWNAMQEDLDEQIVLPWEDRDFCYFECEVLFEENFWEHVGIRYKGNSSMQMPYQQDQEKLPFRLDFDEFEDEYPETDNQRFWGVKWMVFNNNFKDPSMLREKITYDLFREFGVMASHVAHYRFFVDFGEGPVYFGLYTSVEVVDKRFLEDRFGDDSGNLYKPDGPGQELNFFSEETFEKKTNEDEADWSDVINLIDVLNANYSDPQQFKTAIEQIFNIDSFISWLAVNSVLCNLDSYAGTGHNYYLYNNPVDGKFYLIPWDCNESFGSFYGSYNAENMTEWDILHPVDMQLKPLIEKVLWVPEYMDAYKIKVRDLLDGLLSEPVIFPRIDELHDIARPYVIGPDGEFMPYTLLHHQEEFDDNIDSDVPPFGPHRNLGLKPFLVDRRAYIDTVIP